MLSVGCLCWLFSLYSYYCYTMLMAPGLFSLYSVCTFAAPPLDPCIVPLFRGSVQSAPCPPPPHTGWHALALEPYLLPAGNPTSCLPVINRMACLLITKELDVCCVHMYTRVRYMFQYLLPSAVKLAS